MNTTGEEGIIWWLNKDHYSLYQKLKTNTSLLTDLISISYTHLKKYQLVFMFVGIKY